MDAADLAGIITSPPPLPELVSVDLLVDGVNYGTFTPGDGVLVETPLGYVINCQDIAGWPYTPGESIEVTAIANFEDGSMLATTSVLIPVTICFGAGTKILTSGGYRAIDTLAIGDSVMTRDNGLQEIRWIGSTNVPATAMQNDPNLRPVKIAAGTFGANMPETDLTVSCQHRIPVEDWRAELFFDSERVGQRHNRYPRRDRRRRYLFPHCVRRTRSDRRPRPDDRKLPPLPRHRARHGTRSPRGIVQTVPSTVPRQRRSIRV